MKTYKHQLFNCYTTAVLLYRRSGDIELIERRVERFYGSLIKIELLESIANGASARA